MQGKRGVPRFSLIRWWVTVLRNLFAPMAQLAPSGNVRVGNRSIGSVKVALIFCAGTIVV